MLDRFENTCPFKQTRRTNSLAKNGERSCPRLPYIPLNVVGNLHLEAYKLHCCSFTRLFCMHYLLYIFSVFRVLWSKQTLYYYKHLPCFKKIKHPEKSAVSKQYFLHAKESLRGDHFVCKWKVTIFPMILCCYANCLMNGYLRIKLNEYLCIELNEYLRIKLNEY